MSQRAGIGSAASSEQVRVLAVMSEGFGLPQNKMSTPAILNDENADPNSLEHTPSPKPVEGHEMIVHGRDEDEQITTTEFDHSYLGPPAVHGISQQPASSNPVNSDGPMCPAPTSSGPARRVRWRSQRRQTELSLRLVKRRQLAELAGIRAAITGIQMEFAKCTEILTAMLRELKK